MQKHVLVFLLSCSGWCQAQTNHGTNPLFDNHSPYSRGAWLVGLQAGYAKGAWTEPNWATQAYGGQFIADKVFVGLAGSWSREIFHSNQDVTWSSGPLIRYQFTRTRFSPFLVGSYQFGRSALSGGEPQTSTQRAPNGLIITTTRIPNTRSRPIQSRSLGAGMSIRLVAALRIDLALAWQERVESTGLFKHKSWQPQAGIHYLIGGKP